jgi:hypothetical protein
MRQAQKLERVFMEKVCTVFLVKVFTNTVFTKYKKVFKNKKIISHFAPGDLENI